MKKSVRKKANRSGMFPCDICEEKQPLQEHHIRGRDIPQAEHQWNKTNICANCHYKVHLGLIIIKGWQMTIDGMELEWYEVKGHDTTNEDAKTYIIPSSK